MWKWLTVAALIYGLIAAAALIAPRTMLAVAAMDLAALGQAWHEAGPPVPLYDFESPLPPPLTRPHGIAEVVPTGDGNHALRWEPPADVPFALLGLPLAAPEPRPAALTVRLRADGLPRLIVGLREEDGSAYLIDVPVGPDWQTRVIPLAELRPAPRTQDENGQLDVEQVTAVFIARGELPQPRMRRRGQRREAPEPGPALVELDDLGFAPPPEAGDPSGLDRPQPDDRRDRPPADSPPPDERRGPPPGGRRGPPPG